MMANIEANFNKVCLEDLEISKQNKVTQIRGGKSVEKTPILLKHIPYDLARSLEDMLKQYSYYTPIFLYKLNDSFLNIGSDNQLTITGNSNSFDSSGGYKEQITIPNSALKKYVELFDAEGLLVSIKVKSKGTNANVKDKYIWQLGSISSFNSSITYHNTAGSSIEFREKFSIVSDSSVYATLKYLNSVNYPEVFTLRSKNEGINTKIDFYFGTVLKHSVTIKNGGHTFDEAINKNNAIFKFGDVNTDISTIQNIVVDSADNFAYKLDAIQRL